MSAPAILPGLFGEDYGGYDVRPSNFLFSFVLHTLAIVLLVLSTQFVVTHRRQIAEHVISLVPANIGEYRPDPLTEKGRGGGGGDLDKLPASKGGLPKLAREQFAPPAVVIRNPDPKLPVEPTIIAPPELNLPVAAQLGDPFHGVLGPPSNGRGSGGGIGDGKGTGVGPGRGPGAGPGSGGGIYTVGGGVSAPRVLYDPDPDFTEQARRARHQGTVILWLIVGPDGKAHDIQVRQSLGMGLDEKAVAAVQNWRFDPGRLNGTPVPVQIQVAVNFQLH
jgi:TonB family protein